ncbi:MAG: hypothetical protein MEP44_10435 [Blastomonas sp.]|nr:hypothetical protein [Blastomonas sp.]
MRVYLHRTGMKRKGETMTDTSKDTMRTLADGECDLVSGAGPRDVTTLAVGEEDGGGWATTQAIGEEDSPRRQGELPARAQKVLPRYRRFCKPQGL